MKSLIELTGAKILITGASSGIGRQVAITSSKAGAQVFLVARREDELKKTLSMLSGDGHTYYVCDLRKLELLKNLIDDIVAKHGRLNGMAYCAGISETRVYKNTSPDVLKRAMEINFYPFFELVRNFAKKKYSEECSKIVAVSSIASVKGDKGQSAYAASKAALEAASYVLAKELLPRKININCIRPGFVRTPMSDVQLNEMKGFLNLKINPLGIAEPEEIAVLVVYLLSSAANQISGRMIDIDGGAFLM